jgi:hypothetical protein
MMLKLRKYALLLISLVFWPMTFPTGLACYDPGNYDVSSTSVFMPEIVDDKSFDNYFLSMHEFYTNYDTSSIYSHRQIADTSSLEQLNLIEWCEYWPVNDPILLNTLIYSSSTKEIDGILTKLKATQKVNGLYATLFNDNTKLAALEYLKLAKQIEHAVSIDAYGSWESSELNIPEIKRLGELVKARYLKTQDRFLKIRYGYQYVRCCFFSNNYSGGIQFFDTNYSFTPNDGHIYYRALGYKAASHYKLRQYGKANLIYARMYGAFNAFRDIVIQSFHVQNEADWTQTLSMATTLREKELLWHLLGVYSDPVRGMREIAALNPQSNLLPLLMVRAVNIAEYNVFLQNSNSGYDINYIEYVEDESVGSTPGNSWKSVLRENLDELYTVLASIRSQRSNDNAAWAVAQGFVMFLKGDYKACVDQSKNALSLEGTNPLVRAQAAINIIMAQSKTISIVGSTEENDVYKLLNDLSVSGQKPMRAINAESYVLTVLSKIYKKQGNLMLAELAQPGMHKYFEDEFKINQMIDFLKLEQSNLLHNYLKKKYPHSLTDIYDLLAINKIYKGDLLGAKTIYTANPEAGALVLAGNPFSSRIVDCHDCDHYMPQKRKYTKKQFVDELISLKQKAEDASQSKEDRAKNYFNYANGLYNMTYYGNARLVSSNTVLDSYGYYSPYFSEDNSYSGPLSPKGYFDCNQALNNYLNALNLNVSKEFNAVCVWMAAKCEHNLWLETSYNDGQNGDFRSGIYFKKMRNEFYDTQFYNDVINECGYFCQYIRPGDFSCIKKPY